MFSGLAVVAVLIMVFVVIDKKKDEKNAKLILAPHPGDIFEIKTKDNQYTLYKVAQVTGDSVFVRINNYETNKVTGLNYMKRKGDKEFTEDVLPLSKAELKEMLDDGEIVDIDRQ